LRSSGFSEALPVAVMGVFGLSPSLAFGFYETLVFLFLTDVKNIVIDYQIFTYNLFGVVL
jgi:hypothetical protein